MPAAGQGSEGQCRSYYTPITGPDAYHNQCCLWSLNIAAAFCAFSPHLISDTGFGHRSGRHSGFCRVFYIGSAYLVKGMLNAEAPLGNKRSLYV